MWKRALGLIRKPKAHEAIIFMGHHKVGSTALQAYLAEEAQNLLKKGILYPPVDDQSAILTKRPSRKTDADNPDIRNLRTREPHNTLAFAMLNSHFDAPLPKFLGDVPPLPDMKKELKTQIAVHAPDLVLLCSEVFSHFGKNGQTMIRELLGLFEMSEPEAYCVLRRPDDYLASWHAQRLKFGAKLATFQEGALDKYFETIHFDYQLMLRPWIEVLGKEKVHIRSYEAIMKDSDTVADFLKLAGVDRAFSHKPKRTSNPSIPAAGFEIGRRGNHALPSDKAASLRRALIESAVKSGVPKNGEVEMFGGELREKLNEKFRPIADYVDNITETSDFLVTPNDLLKPRDVPERQANKIMIEVISENEAVRADAEIMSFLKDLDTDLSNRN